MIPQLAATKQNGHIEPEITDLFEQTGIDLSLLPAIMTPEQLAPAINTTTNALAQDRHLNQGIPYFKLGDRRVRYGRVSVARFMLASYKHIDVREA